MISQEVKNSFGRCVRDEKFFDRFYEIFLHSEPSIAPMFKKTDMAKQKQLLRQGVSMLLMLDDNSASARMAVDKIAETHGPKGQINVPTKLYPYWIDSLVATVKECDPKFTTTLEREWRAALQRGVDYIIAKGQAAAA